MRPIALFLFLSISIPCLLHSQVKLEFDSSGLLKKAPPLSVKWKKDVVLQIPFSKHLADSQRAMILTRFGYLNRVLSGRISEERTKLEQEVIQLHTFLDKTPAEIKTCIGWSAFIATCSDAPVKHIIAGNAADTAARDTTLPKPVVQPIRLPDCNLACLCAFATKKLTELKSAMKKLEDLEQREELIRWLLCERQKIDPFFQGTSQHENELKLTRDTSIHPESVRFGYLYMDGKEPFSLVKNDDHHIFQRTISNARNAHYVKSNVKSVDLFAKTLLDWHNKQEALLDRKYVKQLSDSVKADRSTLTPLLAGWDDCNQTCNATLVGKLNSINDLLSKYDGIWCKANPVGNWLTNWLWYSGGDFRLNYFSFTSPDNMISEADLEAENARLANLEERKLRVEAIKKCQGCSELTLDTLDRMQDTLARINKDIADINKLRTARAKNESALKKFAAVSSNFHSLQIPLFSSENKRQVLFHDQQNSFERDMTRKAIFPDDRTIYYGFYNSKEKDTAGVLAIKEELSKFNDTGQFLQNLIAATAGLEAATALVNPYAPLVGKLLDNFKSRGRDDTGPTVKESVTRDADSACIRLRNSIRTRLWRFELLEKMLDDYNKRSTPGKLDALTDETSGYHTYTVKAKEGDAPYTNTYSLTYKQKLALTEKFSIGRQKLIAFGAGFFYNEKPAPQVSVDTTGNTFNVSTTDNRAKFVVGVKVFPWKLFEADGGIIPRYPLKRIGVFLGFQATKPLENLYAGLGWDLVPGLQISAGAHFYKRDYYTVQNNRITGKGSNYDASGLYYGITLDPIAISGLLKSFFQ
ncbi:MAG TPA: hypothetical protein VD996_02725 [Chitinophagaceae bacterium]|nr:hypothetical protein [Chitinophagaceae bacterium]